MHLTVLSRSAAIFTTRRIVEAARARGHVVRVVDPLQVEMRLGRDGPEIFHRGRDFPATDVVVPRIAPSISQYGLAVVNHLQLLGLPVLNGAPAIGLARNKMRVLQLLSASGVKVPRTVMASEPSGLRDMVRHVGGLPVLVKLLRGNEKTGVIVCETRQALESALEAILRLGQNTMVPSIRIFQENRLNMGPFFTKVIPYDQGLGAFDMLGLDLKTLQHHPKSAMKIVMKM